METKRTEMVFILDRSGSMAGLEDDTIGGFSSMLEKQKKQPGEAVVTTVLFDNEYELLHDRFDIHNVRPITSDEYYVRGATALLDAVGKTISKIANVQRNSADGGKADKVVFVIITDGMENASREYTLSKVRKMIQLEKDEYGWEFLFLGANIDAEETAAAYGIRADRAVNYHSDPEGVRNTYRFAGEAIMSARTKGCIAEDWKMRAEKDFRERRTGKE